MNILNLFGLLALLVVVVGICVSVCFLLALIFAPNEFFGEDE